MELAQRDHKESLFGDLVFSDKKFSALFDKSISNQERCLTLKAKAGSAIGGFLSCTLGEYFIADDNPQGNVQVVYVTEQVRHTMPGGKRAVKRVKAHWSKAQGGQHVLFYVTSGTRIARTDSCFRKIGIITLVGNYAIRV